MPQRAVSDTADAEFIRLLFRSPVEEEIAYRWAARLGKVIGPQVMALRPTTTLEELLGWAACCGADSIDFVVVFEPELGMEFAQFLDEAEITTFREMVEHYAKRIQRGT